jgi:parvulin-like peptidyl-prolyl isomerase
MTRKIQIAEPLYLGSLNVTKVAIQLQDDIQTICQALKEVLIPQITPVNMYQDTSWDKLSEEEQNAVIEAEIANINKTKQFLLYKLETEVV